MVWYGMVWYHRAVGDNVGREALPLHLVEVVLRSLQVLRFLAGAHNRAVGNDVGREALPLHLIEVVLRSRQYTSIHQGSQYTFGVSNVASILLDVF